jgi:hypothetical protein
VTGQVDVQRTEGPDVWCDLPLDWMIHFAIFDSIFDLIFDSIFDLIFDSIFDLIFDLDSTSIRPRFDLDSTSIRPGFDQVRDGRSPRSFTTRGHRGP